MHKTITRSVPLLVASSLLTLAACVPQTQTPDQSSAGPAQAQMRLPVSLNEVMVAMVNNAADPVWLAAWRHPENDEAWRALERNAYQIQIAGALLAVPGTGPLDEQWTSDPQWRFFAQQLEDVGRRARFAFDNRDIDAIKLAGDDLVEICEGCHIAFKPPEPTGGKFGELSPTSGDFEQD